LTPSSRLFLFCHPHNPVGRAWDEDELKQIVAFCQRHDLVVCSDEIHCGLLLDEDRQHLPLAMLDADLARRSITLMAPSKTWNIPGLGCAFAVIPDAALRRRFTGAMRGIVPHVNVLGLAATEAAYRDCDDWRRALLGVLRRNRDRVEAAVAGLPGLAMSHVEATYLAWINARGLGVADPATFFEAAGVGLSCGTDFALPGWVRLNFGCPPATLTVALERLAAAVAVNR
ncbi:MAG: aminotransferase class I/II-fold pyridoxal phosphate-dependent enzyme, partial [Candidatus Accumulibacter sp. UW27]